jgi:uncharacterized integral membrane protein (TIGR00698 family)
MRKYINGLLLVGAISIFATLLGEWLMKWFQLEALTIAIVTGILISNLVTLPKSFKPGINYALKKLLIYGIVLLGFKLNFDAIMGLGWPVILWIMGYMTFVFGTVFMLNKWFGMNSKLAALIGVGSSVCGAAAVIALAPTIEAEEEDAVIAVSIVSFLGAIGVILYAMIASVSSVSDAQFGVWSGMTLHGVAHALAGAFARGDLAGEIGTFVKMTRVLMLVPVSLILSYAFSSHVETQKRAHVPAYVWLFILMGIINATGVVPAVLQSLAKNLSDVFILMAMTAMGLGVNFKDIKGKGAKAVVFGLLLFAVTSTVAFLLISKGLIV